MNRCYVYQYQCQGCFLRVTAVFPLLFFLPSAFILSYFSFGKPQFITLSACLIMFIHHLQKEWRRCERRYDFWTRGIDTFCMWIHRQDMKIYGSARDEMTDWTDYKQLKLQRLTLWPCRVAYSKGTMQWEEVERNRGYQKMQRQKWRWCEEKLTRLVYVRQKSERREVKSESLKN